MGPQQEFSKLLGLDGFCVKALELLLGRLDARQRAAVKAVRAQLHLAKRFIVDASVNAGAARMQSP